LAAGAAAVFAESCPHTGAATSTAHATLASSIPIRFIQFSFHEFSNLIVDADPFEH
jgi:hypothetical protein